MYTEEELIKISKDHDFKGIIVAVENDPENIVEIFNIFLNYNYEIEAEQVKEFINRGLDINRVYDDIGFDESPASFMISCCQFYNLVGLEAILANHPEYPTEEGISLENNMFDVLFASYLEAAESINDLEYGIELIQKYGDHPKILTERTVYHFRDGIDGETEFITNFINSCTLTYHDHGEQGADDEGEGDESRNY